MDSSKRGASKAAARIAQAFSQCKTKFGGSNFYLRMKIECTNTTNRNQSIITIGNDSGNIICVHNGRAYTYPLSVDDSPPADSSSDETTFYFSYIYDDERDIRVVIKRTFSGGIKVWIDSIPQDYINLRFV